MIELWFLFCDDVVDWRDRRRRLAQGHRRGMRELDAQIPHKDSVYEYYIDPKKKGWVALGGEAQRPWRRRPTSPSTRSSCPPSTRRATRTSSPTSHGAAERHVLLTGDVGVGKTSIVVSTLATPRCSRATRSTSRSSSTDLNFSAQTQVHARVGRRSRRASRSAPRTPSRRRAARSSHLHRRLQHAREGDLRRAAAARDPAPVDAVRVLVRPQEADGQRFIKDTQLVAAMGHPGGGRTVISARTLHKFHVLNMTFPDRTQLIKRIFGTLITSHLADLRRGHQALGDMMTNATIEMYSALDRPAADARQAALHLQPPRHLARLPGRAAVAEDYFDTRDAMIRLWATRRMPRLRRPAHQQRPTASTSTRSSTRSSPRTFQTDVQAPLQGRRRCTPLATSCARCARASAPYEELADRRRSRRSWRRSSRTTTWSRACR